MAAERKRLGLRKRDELTLPDERLEALRGPILARMKAQQEELRQWATEQGVWT